MRRGDDRGSFAIELAVLAPVFILLIAVIISAGQIVTARSEAQNAARDAARAATITVENPADPQSYAVAAEQALSAALAGASLNCPEQQISPDVQVVPDQPLAGEIRVTLRCNIDTATGYTQSVNVSAASPVDPYRGGVVQ